MATSTRIMLNTATEDAIVPFAQRYTNFSLGTSQEGSIGNVSGACCCLETARRNDNERVVHRFFIFQALLASYRCRLLADRVVPEFYPFNSRVSCMTITTQQPQCIGVHTY